MAAGLTQEKFFDKVYGAWTGKCLGGASGARVEGIKSFDDKRDYIKLIDTTLPNDDLDIQLMWLDCLENFGADLTSDDMADCWDKNCWYPFSEYGVFLKNYERGIAPPLSGRFNNPVFCDGMGCAIRSEIWALAFAGDVGRALAFCEYDSGLDHFGDGAEAEKFLTLVESFALFESDIPAVLKKSLKKIDSASKVYACIDFVLKNSETMTVRRLFDQIVANFGHSDFTNAVQNLGFIVLALVKGEMQFDKTIDIALSCGYDTDCTAASACAVLGIVKGFSGIEARFRDLVSDKLVVGINAKKREGSIRRLSLDTVKLHSALCGDGDILFLEKPYKNLLPKIRVEYEDTPSIAPDAIVKAHVTVENAQGAGVKIINESSLKVCSGTPERSDGKYTVDVSYTAGVNVECKNIVTLEIDTIPPVRKRIGLAGAGRYRVRGPFTEALQKPDAPHHPPCHSPGCLLPNLECMVNNFVSLDTHYIDEATFDGYAYDKTVVCPTDMLEPNLTLHGQAAYYMWTDIETSEAVTVWAVIGNSDAFVMWVNGEEILRRDEIRLWMPYNNNEFVSLKKGVNRIAFKLLRRTESSKFSFALRRFEGKHWHRNRWFVDYKYIGDKD